MHKAIASALTTLRTTPEAPVAKKDNLDQMRAEAHRRQDNLASDIDELIDRINPKNAVTRWKNELVGSVKDFSAAGDGKDAGLSPAVIAGGVIGSVVLAAGAITAIALANRPSPAQREAKKAHKASVAARKDFAKQASKVAARGRASSKDADKAIRNAQKTVAEYLTRRG